MNENNGFAACGGSGRSCQVSPRSVLRKSRVFATSAQITVPEGALIWATFGSGISVGDAVGAAVAAVGAAVVGADVDVGVGLATATVALGAAAGAAQAAKVRTNSSEVSRFMRSVWSAR